MRVQLKHAFLWRILLVLLHAAAILATSTSATKGYDKSSIKSDVHHQVTTDDSRVVWPWRSYRTSKHTPPDLNITRHNGNGKLADGYYFLSPSDSNKNDGTYDMSGTGFVMDHNGDLIFAGDEDGFDFCEEWIAGMTDFRVQEYNGRKYITYWNGCNTRGTHWGHRWGRVRFCFFSQLSAFSDRTSKIHWVESFACLWESIVEKYADSLIRQVTFIDEEYNKFTLNPDLGINTLEPATRGNIDVHEHQMTDRNTIVVSSYNNTQWDLTSVDGAKDAWVADGMFFEIEPKTQEVLFQWRALEHLELSASRYGLNGAGTKRVPLDWLHINSVQRVGENYLISARHHFAVYLISGKDGSVIWKLDGTDGGSFGSIPANFRWQHHARAQNITDAGMTVSLFNNMVNGKHNEDTQTNGLAFWLPLPPDPKNPPILVKKLQQPGEMVFSGTQGSFQMDLGNGNSLVGYGTTPIVREFSAAGKLIWQAQFGELEAVQNYRAFKMPWHGTPKHWDPVVLLESPHDHVPRAYVSWNGATQISGWAVFAGESHDSLESVGVAKKKAFETVFELGNNVRCAQIGAIRDGKIIRKSNIACLSDDEKALPENGLLGNDKSTDDNIPLDSDYSRLLAENEQLLAELDELESTTWAAYELFAKVAIGTVVVVIAFWVVILLRDWRQRRRYQPVPKEAW
jgi:hypothetical protein